MRLCWDAHPNGNVRVSAGIDDGGLRAFLPLTSDFIKAPDGSFVGESILTNAVGKTVIGGLTYRNHVGEVERQVQYWGEIVRVSPREGVVIVLPSVRNGAFRQILRHSSQHLWASTASDRRVRWSLILIS